MTTPRVLTAFGLVCSLKPSPQPSSSELLARQVLDALVEYGVDGTLERAVDHDIKPGVEADLGDGDAWPALRERMLAADVFLIATPTWMGHLSSVAQRVLERLDAELSDTDDAGRMRTYGKVAGAVVVGNEDGAHKISADLFQALNDVGFSLAPGCGDVLERRGDEQDRLHGLRHHAGAGRDDDRRAGCERRPPGPAARDLPVPTGALVLGLAV
jgi:NAD(P)H-dependent FMN reductase